MGLRLGDNIESHTTSGEVLPFNRWYRQSYDQREILFDRRRYPLYTSGNREEDHCPANAIRSRYNPSQETLTSKSPFDIYLGSLKYGQDKIGETWQSFSKDADNVIIISNHYKDAAMNTSIGYQFDNPSFEHEVNWSFLTLFTDDDLQISPTTEAKLDDNANVASLYKRIDYVRLAGVLGHEYMHSIYIADEYERRTGSPGSSTNERPNLANKTHLLKPGTSNKIDAKKIKWNLRRVALSSMVIGNVTINNNILTVKLEVGQGKRWQKVLDNNLPLYIRSSRFQPNPDIIFYERTISKITEIDINSDTLKLELKEENNIGNPNLALLNRGCHIYLPKRLNDDYANIKENPELHIINPRVLQYMINTETSLREKQDCDVISRVPSYPPSDLDINNNSNVLNPDPENPPPIYPPFKSPTNSFLVPGAYEGGGYYICNVYRPNGWSLMRLAGIKSRHISDEQQTGRSFTLDNENPTVIKQYSIYSRFDFFSKYYFIATLYPTKLDFLDENEYVDYDSSNI